MKKQIFDSVAQDIPVTLLKCPKSCTVLEKSWLRTSFCEPYNCTTWWQKFPKKWSCILIQRVHLNKANLTVYIANIPAIPNLKQTAFLLLLLSLITWRKREFRKIFLTKMKKQRVLQKIFGQPSLRLKTAVLRLSFALQFFCMFCYFNTWGNIQTWVKRVQWVCYLGKSKFQLLFKC